MFFYFIKDIFALFIKYNIMMQVYLGYILSSTPISNIPYFIKVYNYDKINEIILLNKPMIIIGYENAKNFYGKDFNILNKNIRKDNIFWTFGKREKRIDFETDLEYFYNFILKNVNKTVKYTYINVLKLSFNKAKKLINLIYSDEKKYIYINKDMIYIYMNNNIMGISIKVLEFIGINIEKVFLKIKSNINNKIATNYKIPYNIKKIINQEYMTPFFYSLNND